MPGFTGYALLLLATMFAARAFADDAALVELHAQLAPLRAAPIAGSGDARGPWHASASGEDFRFATPALTVAKHQLRDWIEARIATAPETAPLTTLAAELNAALREADLFCQKIDREDAQDRCAFESSDWNSIGFVYPDIRLDRPAQGLLVVRAGLGIECGSDTSAYAYEWREGRWRRFWQYEQAIEDGVPYEPQWIDSVLVSEPDLHGARLVLQLGNMDWCSSTFYPVYARLWRTVADSDSKLLLRRAEHAWLGDDPPVTGTLSLTGAEFEFERPGIDISTHTAVMHFRVAGERVTRIAPFARDPRSFVEEWLHTPWAESREWLVPDVAARVAPWHQKLNGELVRSDHMVVHRCRGDAALRQVTVPLFDGERSLGTVFVLLAARAADRFEMRAIGTTPRAGCDERVDE